MHFDVHDKISTLLHKKLFLLFKEAMSLKVFKSVCCFILLSCFSSGMMAALLLLLRSEVWL